ncbi:MAG: isopenicillin N synthase family dioxygenase [Acidimicrobiales bacterium]
MSIPIINLAPFARSGRSGTAAERGAVGRQIDQACRQVGFFSVIGHGIAPEIIEEAHRAALSFFDLPLADRLGAAKPEPTYPYGYTPYSAEALNRSIGGSGSPDLKETYNVGPVGSPPRPLIEMTDTDERDVWSPTLWPPAMPELRPALVAYYRAMADLAATLMDGFAEALGLGRGWFESFIDEHSSALRLAHYPGLPERPPNEALRAGAHTDYGTLTILRLDGEPGLQVQGEDGTWADVTAPEGALVINLGDLMQRWTNDRWRSTMHRVVVPEGRHQQRRLTMPFFHNANWDARVECIVADGEQARHRPVLAGAHLMSKFRSTVG